MEWGVMSAAACTATAAVEVIESWTLLTVEFGSLAAKAPFTAHYVWAVFAQ